MCDGHDVLFSGDTLFSLGCGRLFEGSPEQMLDSLTRWRPCPTRRGCAAAMNTPWPTRRSPEVEPDNPALQRRTEQARRFEAMDVQRFRPRSAKRRQPIRSCGPKPPGCARYRERLGRAPADRVEAFAECGAGKTGSSHDRGGLALFMA